LKKRQLATWLEALGGVQPLGLYRLENQASPGPQLQSDTASQLMIAIWQLGLMKKVSKHEE